MQHHSKHYQIPVIFCYIHFQINTIGKGINPLIPPDMVHIVSLLSLYKDSIGIKLTTKIDMPLKQKNCYILREKQLFWLLQN